LRFQERAGNHAAADKPLVGERSDALDRTRRCGVAAVVQLGQFAGWQQTGAGNPVAEALDGFLNAETAYPAGSEPKVG
jgi:hypothetical protein